MLGEIDQNALTVNGCEAEGLVHLLGRNEDQVSFVDLYGGALDGIGFCAAQHVENLVKGMCMRILHIGISLAHLVLNEEAVLCERELDLW